MSSIDNPHKAAPGSGTYYAEDAPVSEKSPQLKDQNQLRNTSI